VKPNINSVEVHPQPSNNRHPLDGVLVGAGSLWLGLPGALPSVKDLQTRPQANEAPT
jgi:hypothetical protein